MTELAVPEAAAEPSRTGTFAVLALLTFDGALLGAFGLLFTPIYSGGFPVPMGVAFTVLILPWLVWRVGELDPRPGPAAAPVVAWFVVVAALSLGGPGGDVMIEVSWQTALLVFGGIGAGLWAWRSVVLPESPR